MSRPSAEIVNPVLALPGVAEDLAALTPTERETIVRFLLALQAKARPQAEENWRRNKGPIAVYWKCVGVYSGHMARAIRRVAKDRRA